MQVNVQIRFPAKTIGLIDEEVKEGYFTSRSEAIRTIIEMYELHKKRGEFFTMLDKRAKDIDDGKYITLKELE